jgi:hypothetical protein
MLCTYKITNEIEHGDTFPHNNTHTKQLQESVDVEQCDVEHVFPTQMKHPQYLMTGFNASYT